MITKERLKELIEQGATIYTIYGGYLSDIQLNRKYDYVTDNHLFEADMVAGEVGYRKYTFNILFETKEEAEWQAEFGCIERTERLVLPTWEDFRNSSGFDFVSKNKQTIYVMNHFLDNEIYITDQWGYNETFEYTPNGYIEACRKAKELFLKGKEQ